MLPALGAGVSCQVGLVDLKALKTLPPKPYTQGELVKAMKGVAKLVTDPRLKQKLKDTTGIGTEATRANIISGLLARGYLLKKGRAIRASDAAFTLIDAVPAAIADPGTTAVWEQALDMIEAGQMTLDTFIAKQSAWVAQLVQQYRGATLPLAAARAELPAVRRPDAPAHWQERRVLVVQPLPGLQGHAAGRNRDRQARSATPAASVSEGELTPTFPLPRRLLPTAGHTSAPRGTPQRAFPSATVCASCTGRSRLAGREGHCSIESRAPRFR